MHLHFQFKDMKYYLELMEKFVILTEGIGKKQDCDKPKPQAQI